MDFSTTAQALEANKAKTRVYGHAGTAAEVLTGISRTVLGARRTAWSTADCTYAPLFRNTLSTFEPATQARDAVQALEVVYRPRQPCSTDDSAALFCASGRESGPCCDSIAANIAISVAYLFIGFFVFLDSACISRA